MLLQSCGGPTAELSRSAQACSAVPSPCKLKPFTPSLHSNSFLGFSTSPHAFNNFQETTKNPNDHNGPHSFHGVFLGFKHRCHSKTVSLLNKNVNSNKGKKKKAYGGILPSVLRALEGENDVEKALGAYCAKLSPREQTVVLKEQGRWDKVLRVFGWFKGQEGYVSNVIHYNVVLRALGRAQEWDELRLCWIEMAKNGVVPTNNTYGMLVDVYGKAGLVKEALLWIKHMKSRGIFPDEVTMCSVVKVLKDAGEYDRADRFYKDWCDGKVEVEGLDLGDEQDNISLKEFLSTELFRTGKRLHNSSSVDFKNCEGKKPRLTATYNALIDLYGKAGRLEDAANVFSDMLKAGVAMDTFTFNTMIFICGSNGHLSEAEALLDKMEERGISPDTKTYNVLLSLYASAGNIDGVIQCYRKIREVGLFPDDVTHRAVLKILSERSMVHEVEAVIQEMQVLGKRIDESSIPLLTKMYIDVGMNERVKSLIELKNGFSSRTCAAIIDVYAEKGLWAEAEALFYQGERKKDVVEYNVMIKAYGMGEIYDKAVSLFRGMRNQGMWPDECTYNSLIQMLAKGDIEDEARELLAEMMKAGFRPACSTFSAVISCFAKKKRLSDAVDLFQEMLRTDVKPNVIVYGSLIDAFAEDGKFEEANRYFRIMEDSGISANEIILTSMIKAYGKIGSAEGAKQIYEKMKNPDIVASNSMLNVYAELGMLSEAKAVYNDLRERGLADGVTFATMMYVYKNMGMLDEAIEVAGEMKESGLMRDCVTYNKVMACYAANGMLVDCGELLHEMVANQKLLPDGGTFKVLFTVLKKGGVPSEAVRQLESSYKEGKPFAKQAVITSVFSIAGLHAYAFEFCGVFDKEEIGLNSFAYYNAAIRAYTAYGKVDEALNMYMRMQDEGIEPDLVTLINLVTCYGKAGMVEGVKRIHSQLKYGEIEPNESLYKAILDAYKNVNRHDLVDLVSQEMKLACDVHQIADSAPHETSLVQ